MVAQKLAEEGSDDFDVVGEQVEEVLGVESQDECVVDRGRGVRSQSPAEDLRHAESARRLDLRSVAFPVDDFDLRRGRRSRARRLGRWP